MILVRTTPATIAAGTTGTVTETATRGTDTTSIGTMTDVTTEIDGPGMTKGGINVFSNRKPPRGYNILCSSFPIRCSTVL